MRTKVAVATAALLLALTACGSAEDDAEPSAEATSPAAEESAEAPTPPEPDLEGLPDVVAEVNGSEVTLEEFTQVYEGQLQQAFMQSQMTGEEVDQEALKQTTAEGLVDTELLLAEADARSISASQEEIDAAAEEIAAASGLGSANELFTALEEQGLSREEALGQLEEQTTLEQLFADEAGDFTPSEEDARELYDSAAEQGGGEGSELPEFEEVRPQIEAQLEQQHEGEAVQALLEELRADADITYHL